MPSVVIAAHNEEYVIGRTLDALLSDQPEEPLEIIVCANGCTDRTVAIASRAGVTVLDLPKPGKAGALNAGDAMAKTFPRIYLDADITVPEGGIGRILSALASQPSALAAVPRRELNTTGRPWLVRSYLAINEKLPAFQTGLFGRGLIAISEQGRCRFDEFPGLIADDLFLDSQFHENEKIEASDVVVVVESPHTSRDLLRRLVRVRRGNSEMRAASRSGRIDVPIRSSDRWAWLREVVLRNPRLAAATIPYIGFTLIAALLARSFRSRTQAWGRDESTRANPSRR